MTKSIIVFTATGDQGRSVALTMFDAGWQVTGTTRNTDSPTSMELTQKGIRMVRGDLDDPSTYAKNLRGMDAAFVNADFFVTFFSNGMNSDAAMETEIKQSKSAIDACVEAGIKHIIYSALESLGQGKEVPFCLSKSKVANYLRSLPVACTYLYTCTYFSDFLKFHQLNPNPDKNTGGFLLTTDMPDDTEIPMFPVEQLGLWARAALTDPDKWIGKDIPACSEHISPAQMASTISRLYKVPVTTSNITKELFYSKEHQEKSTYPLWTYFRANVEKFFIRDLNLSKTINPECMTFEQWAMQSKELQAALKA